jgi:hypothetical protein
MKRSYLCFCFAILAAPLADLRPAVAQDVPHVEDCTKWHYTDGKFGTANSCDKSIVVNFMRKSDQHAVIRTLRPAEKFNTGLSQAQVESGWWMFTACPVGFVSSVPFLAENESIIVPSKYRCVRK